MTCPEHRESLGAPGTLPTRPPYDEGPHPCGAIGAALHCGRSTDNNTRRLGSRHHLQSTRSAVRTLGGLAGHENARAQRLALRTLSEGTVFSRRCQVVCVTRTAARTPDAPAGRPARRRATPWRGNLEKMPDVPHRASGTSVRACECYEAQGHSGRTRDDGVTVLIRRGVQLPRNGARPSTLKGPLGVDGLGAFHRTHL